MLRREKEFTLTLLVVLMFAAIMVAALAGIYLFSVVVEEAAFFDVDQNRDADDLDSAGMSAEHQEALGRIRIRFLISGLAYVSLLFLVAAIAAKRIVRTYHQRRLNLESTLFRQQHDFRHLVDNLGEIVFTLALDGRFTFLNQQGSELLQLEQPLYYKEEFFSFVHPDDREQVQAAFSQAINGIRENRVVFRLIKRNKWEEPRVVEMSTIVLVESGKKVGFIGLIRDLTTRLQMEQTLEESKQLLEVTFDSITDGIIVIDTDMMIEMENRTEKEYLDLIGKDFSSAQCYNIYGNRSSPCPGCAVIETFKTGRNHSMEFIRVSKEEEQRNLMTYTYPLASGQDGKIERAVVFLKDITGQKKLQLRLLDSARMATIGEMAAVMAHEIRTPLISIGGYARSVQKQFENGSKEYESVSIIIEEVARLERFLKDQLDFAGPMKPELLMGDLHELIDGVISFYREELKKEQIECVKQYDRRIPGFQFDPHKLHRVILNVVQNAIDSMKPDPGELKVTTKMHENKAVVIVSDSGSGIPDEIKDNILEPFTSGKAGGTGLGLPIALRIVRLHGGDMTIDSVENVGTRVYITIPILVSVNNEPT